MDGSNFSILPNPDEPQNRVPGHGEDRHALHFNAAYDLINLFYVNCLVQSAANKNEYAAALHFIHQYHPGIPIWVGDRLYLSYELVTQIQEAGHRFLFRMKENNFLQLLESWQSLDDPMDFETSRMLVSTQRAETRCFPELCKYVPKGKASAITEEHLEFFLAFRLLCVTLETPSEETGKTETSFEYLITNLDQNEFSTEEIKELYHLRWNIETSFRDLKYVLKAGQVHSRKQNLIEQEIDMAVMVYNLIQAVSRCATVPQKGRKYQYQTNFTALSEVVMKFINGKATQKDVIWTIQNVTESIRKNRHFKRESPTTVKTSHWKQSVLKR